MYTCSAIWTVHWFSLSCWSISTQVHCIMTQPIQRQNRWNACPNRHLQVFLIQNTTVISDSKLNLWSKKKKKNMLFYSSYNTINYFLCLMSEKSFHFLILIPQSISGARIALNYSNNLPEHILPSPYVEDYGNPENRQIISSSQWSCSWSMMK